MEIVTSYFGNAKALKREGFTICSIARYDPDWMKPDTKLIQLAPTSDMLKMEWSKYDKLYQEILRKVDLKFTANILRQYEKVALVCWEKDVNDCHRKHAAEFLSVKFSIDIPEFVDPSPVKEKPVKKKSVDTQISMW